MPSGLPAPRFLCCNRESTIAEKLEAIVKPGELNSRMKHFYDIWLLSRQFDFTGRDLVKVIRLIFTQRYTEFPETIVAVSAAFSEAK